MIDRKNLEIGHKVRIPSKDIVRWDGDEYMGFAENIVQQTEKILYVRELNNPNGIGLSYSMDTPPEKSFFVKNEYILPVSEKIT